VSVQDKGQAIGHYRVIEKIGSGAMGDVFRARDERLGRDVALKLIRPASTENPDHLRRFELEARAAASLNHPNIVAIYDVGFADGIPYIVCELLEGKTLRKLLLEGPLAVRIALDYAQQISQGLIAAHDRRIVHRDLKPENLFVTVDGRVKILDFGVAKLQPVSNEAGRTVEELTTVTRSGAVIGTVAYMSPEQLRGKAVDHRSDIFSLGAILYEMLTGHRAFQGETVVDTMTAVLLYEPREIELEQANIPASFQHIVRHCLEKDPENRFQSARELAFALETLSDLSHNRTKRAPIRPRARILPWVVAGMFLIATVLLLITRWQGRAQSPTYHRLTFEQGTVYSARFAPDYRSIVYGAAWNGRPKQLYSTVANSLLPQPLSLSDAVLLGVSRSGELALTLNSARGAHLLTQSGTLATAPLAGGSPREVLNNVTSADWDANNELAVVHHNTDGRDQIEYPLGHVLYRSNRGMISHIRLSPQGDRIAFMDQPMQWDDGGSVDIVDLQGHVSVLSRKWASEAGLAWAPDGKEVWFTSSESGANRALFAVDMTGHMRTILTLPGAMTLQDIAPDGRVLVSLDAERLALATMARGDTKPVDLSSHEWNVAKDISPDGQSILFEDDGQSTGPHFSTAIRKIDGTPPVRLSEGSPSKLSPDGKSVISIVLGKPGKVSLIPIGVGQPRTIALPEFEEIHQGTDHFLKDGKHFTLNANEPGHAERTYLVDLEGKKPIPITPEGMTGDLISPDGQYIFRPDNAGTLAIYPTVAGGTPRYVPDLEPRFYPIQWSDDNSSVYGYIRGQIPTKVYKVNLKTGKKTLVQELQPETTAGAVTITSVCVSRDGSRFAYSYYQVLSDLYIISGLH
jgi:eukaryotic-like serine/threonine-protein kinase